MSYFQVICDDLEIRNVDSFGRKKRNSNVEKWLKAGVSLEIIITNDMKSELIWKNVPF